jgi:hypothetical protein
MHRRLQTELPGRVLPPLPKKNRSDASITLFSAPIDEDTSSLSSTSTQPGPYEDPGPLKAIRSSHKRSASAQPTPAASRHSSPRRSLDDVKTFITLFREEQRVSLRAFLRTLLHNPQIAATKTMAEFLAGASINLNEEEKLDLQRRREMDEKRAEEQRRFYEIARLRARELDVHMEQFRREIIDASKGSSSPHPSPVPEDCATHIDSPSNRRVVQTLHRDTGQG